MFEQYIEFQDRIHAIVDRAEANLRNPAGADFAALGQTRWEAARALREYELFTHSRIFDPLIRGPDYRALKARTMKADCVRMGEQFRAYVLKWSVVSIADHWAEFYPAALDVMALIRTHLARERTGVSELVEAQSAA